MAKCKTFNECGATNNALAYKICERTSRKQTQADRIRAMSDEELAEFLKTTVAELGDNLFKCSDYYKSTLCKGGACGTCGVYLEWLKSEAKE